MYVHRQFMFRLASARRQIDNTLSFILAFIPRERARLLVIFSYVPHSLPLNASRVCTHVFPNDLHPLFLWPTLLYSDFL